MKIRDVGIIFFEAGAHQWLIYCWYGIRVYDDTFSIGPFPIFHQCFSVEYIKDGDSFYATEIYESLTGWWVNHKDLRTYIVERSEVIILVDDVSIIKN